MLKTITKLGPQDHGRPMSLKEFEFAQGQEGYLYELGRGEVVVMEVPGFPHFRRAEYLRDHLAYYRLTNPGIINSLATGMECKLLLDEMESERHPEMAIYLSPRPKVKDFWARWVPDVVVEVVSPSSRVRDLVEKSEEYLALGVKEYWIIDGEEQEIRILRRSRGRWVEKMLHAGDKYQTKLLPGFELDCSAVLAAGDQL